MSTRRRLPCGAERGSGVGVGVLPRVRVEQRVRRRTEQVQQRSQERKQPHAREETKSHLQIVATEGTSGKSRGWAFHDGGLDGGPMLRVMLRALAERLAGERRGAPAA